MPANHVWGTVGLSFLDITAAGLGCASDLVKIQVEGRSTCFLWHSSRNANHPSVASLDGLKRLTLIGEVDLYNRDSLSKALGAEDSTFQQPSGRLVSAPAKRDAELVLAAYAKWGRECASRLEGEFNFGIWDSQSGVLFLCRDHLGSRPLFYWQNAHRFIFSTDPLIILRFPPVSRKLNRRKLAALAAPHGWESHPDETLHADIYSLPPGTSLTVSAQTLTLHRYWTLQLRAGLVPTRQADAFEMARELMFAAVRNRIRDKKVVAIRLSGGLDSSAVGAIAAQCLAESNQSLLAFAGVIPDPGSQHRQDEREYIDEFLSFPNVQIHRITAEGAGPFDSLNSPGEYEACFPFAPTRFLGSALANAAVAQGADILLDGSYGELGPTASGRGYYADLAVALHWKALATELGEWRAIRPGENQWAPLRHLGSEFIDLLSPYRGARRGLTFYLSRDFRNECEAHGLRKPGWRNQQTRQRDDVQEFLSRHAAVHLTIARAEIDMSFPLLDRHLLEFCLAAPGNMKVHGGYTRYLVRRALDGILPRKIQWRTTKLPFSPDYLDRFQAQLPMAKAYLASISPRDPVRAIVDVQRIGEDLQTLRPETLKSVGYGVPASLYMISFLRQFAEFQP